MSEEIYDDLAPPGFSARDLAPEDEDNDLAPEDEDKPDRISLHRRQSRTIAPPRKWRMSGLSQRICPECRAIVPSIQDGFWHLQTTHGQGKGVDLEAWGTELRDELDEFRAAAEGRRGLLDHQGSGNGTENLTAVILVVMAAMAVFFVVYLLIGMK